MRLLFTICGRKGSKGIKNKNIKDFLGYPLPYYTLSVIDLYRQRCSAKSNAQCEMDVVVNSDSEELLKIMSNNPFLPVELIVRVPELGGDAVGKVEVIRDCMIQMQERRGYSYNMVIDLDITSPLRTVTDLENLIEMQISTGADVTTSVTEARRNPYFNMVKKTEHGYAKVLASNYTSRQQAPELYDMNASLYAYTPQFLKSGRNVLDGYVECIKMYDTGVLDLDHVNDFELMQVIADYLYKNKIEFGEIQENIKEKMKVLQIK